MKPPFHSFQSIPVITCRAPFDLKTFRWAIGLCESRAFDAGNAHQAFVPFLDLANHQPNSGCFHEYSVERAAFELRCTVRDPAPASEALITYGATKSNRVLMEQYGFFLQGNPFDRLAFPNDVPQRMRRDWILRVLGLDQDFGDDAAGAALRCAGAEAAVRIFSEETSSDDDDATSMPSPTVAQELARIIRSAPGHRWVTALQESGRAEGAALAGRVRAVTGSLLQSMAWRGKAEFAACGAESDRAVFTAAREWLEREVRLQGGGRGLVDLDLDLDAGAGGGLGSGTEGPRVRMARAYAAENAALRRTALGMMGVLEDVLGPRAQ